MRPDLAIDLDGLRLDLAGQHRLFALANSLAQLGLLVECADPGVVRPDHLGQLIGVLAGGLAAIAAGSG